MSGTVKTAESQTITVRMVEYGSAGYRAMLELRNRVLRVPLGLNLFEEDLSADENRLHFALYDGDTMLGTMLLDPADKTTARMKQVAVDPAVQGRGLGRILAEHVERYAREAGFRRMILDARATAVGFYEALGYVKSGEPFMEVTIPHYFMEKTL